jgi:hypothetical protein
LHPTVAFAPLLDAQKDRIPDGSRDPSISGSIVETWIPAFAGNADLSGIRFWRPLAPPIAI